VNCTRCFRTFSLDDTVVVGFGSCGLCHVDCQRARTLNAEERVLLITYCSDHPVAESIACTGNFKMSELAVDILSGATRVCPRWRQDLTDSIRAHIYGCVLVRKKFDCGRTPRARLCSVS
jgi:hypothetical protein